MCTSVCASGCCPGQVPVCPCSSRADESSPIPHQAAALALLCSKARNSLSPDKNCIAKLLFHKQLPCIRGSLPHPAGAERGDPEAELSQAGVQPRLPSQNLPGFYNGTEQEKKAETSSFYLGIEGEVSQVWLDNSIWMELCPVGVVKS